jgi:hypothetical protein
LEFVVPADLVRPSTLHTPLSAVLDRLRAHAEVDGVVLLGTTGTERLTPVSDYDLLVILAESAHEISVEITIIDGRTADIIIASRSCLSSISDASRDLTDDEWALAHWLVDGRIVYDRTTELGFAATSARTRLAHRPPAPRRVTDLAQHINYDLRVNRAYARSADPTYRLALRLRSLHTFFRIVMGWFEIRGMPWEGEKQALRYLSRQDPEFLALVEKWLTEPDVTTAIQIERQAAERVLSPAGGLWPDDMVARYEGVWERLASTAHPIK